MPGRALTDGGVSTQVFIATPPDKCKEWNMTRPEGSRYLKPTLVDHFGARQLDATRLTTHDLTLRYPQPRFDRPTSQPLTIFLFSTDLTI